MEQPNENIGTKKDLVCYRLQTAKADLKSLCMMRSILRFNGGLIYEGTLL
ncbi:hypothetical protein NXH76_21625 [Blautia schinkii]|nr:hypothetical protein [Blautia schinkii]